MSAQQAWDRVAQDEADALAKILATDGRCVMVIIVGADSDEQGTVHLCHAVAGQTTGSHLRQFIAGVERKLEWLRDKLYRRA
jgi:hypothetical protein